MKKLLKLIDIKYIGYYISIILILIALFITCSCSQKNEHPHNSTITCYKTHSNTGEIIYWYYMLSGTGNHYYYSSNYPITNYSSINWTTNNPNIDLSNQEVIDVQAVQSNGFTEELNNNIEPEESSGFTDSNENNSNTDNSGTESESSGFSDSGDSGGGDSGGD